MTHTLRILWELFKKNTPRHSLIGNILFLSIATIAAGFGGPEPSPELWIPGLFWITLMGVAGGAAAFNLDLTKGGMRFLEYLPVRRWHVWLANVADGFFWVLLFAVAMTWHRTLLWSPAAANPDGYNNGLAAALFSSRFTLLAGALSLSFCAFSVATFFRLAVQRESAALFRTMMGAITTIFMIGVLPLAMLVTPSLTDLQLPLFLVGLLYLLAGLFIFLFVPPEWGYWRRAVLVNWPLTVLLTLLTVVVTVSLSLHWARLDVADVTSARVIRLPDRSDRVVLLDVTSNRSANHLLRLDTRTGDYVELGRGLTPVVDTEGTARPVGRDGDFVAWSQLSRYGTISRERRTLRVSSAATSELLPPGGRFNVDGLEFEADAPAYTTDGLYAVLIGSRRNANSGGSAVLVVDADARVLRRLPAATGTLLAFDPNAARLLYRIAGADDTYRIHDLHAGNDSEPFRLPGELLDCAPDLSVAVCRHFDSAGDTVRQSVLLVDLRTLESRPLVAADEMPTLKEKPDEYDRFPRFLTADASGGHEINVDDLHMFIDPAYHHAVRYFLHDGPRYFRDPDAIVSCDLRTGKRATLVPKSELAPLGQDWVGRGVNFLRFTPDASAVLVEIDRRVERISLDASSRTILARRPDGEAHYPKWSFSPSLRHLLYVGFSGRSKAYEVTTPGADIPTVQLPADLFDANSVDFLDDDHLLISKAGRVYVSDLAGGQRKQVFGRPE